MSKQSSKNIIFEILVPKYLSHIIDKSKAIPPKTNSNFKGKENLFKVLGLLLLRHANQRKYSVAQELYCDLHKYHERKYYNDARISTLRFFKCHDSLASLNPPGGFAWVIIKR